MDYDSFDREEYKGIALYRMEDNRHGALPFFIRRYDLTRESTELHRHEYMQINYICRGKGKHFIKNNGFDIVKGDIFIVPPFIPHRISELSGEALSLYEFEFEPGYINRNFRDFENAESFLDFAYIEPFLVSENLVKPGLNLSGESQMEAENILEEALSEFKKRESGFELIIKALLLKLLVIAGRAFSKEIEQTDQSGELIRHRDLIKSAVEHIKTNYMEDLSSEEVSRKFLLSPSYFRYLFKSITSKTFTEYLNGIRVARAAELLCMTDRSVIDISLETGFNSVTHFNRVFRQFTGTTPSAYKKRPASLIT